MGDTGVISTQKNKMTKTINRIKELELELEIHKSKYIHIPKPCFLPILGMIIFGLLSWGNLYLSDWGLIKLILFENAEEEVFQFSQLINVYPIIGEYILISLFFISLVALFKGGYKNLNEYNEEGLIGGLIGGLIFGLIFGLICGLIGGLICGLICGLIGGLICGLICGLIWGFN